jgi:hypothetical protein
MFLTLAISGNFAQFVLPTIADSDQKTPASRH